MTEKLHRMVNGKPVELTEAEEADIRAEWAANDAARRKAAYAQERRDAYLPLTELADALTKKASPDPAMRSEGATQEAAYYAHNLAVKAQFPKPAEAAADDAEEAQPDQEAP